MSHSRKFLVAGFIAMTLMLCGFLPNVHAQGITAVDAIPGPPMLLT